MYYVSVFVYTATLIFSAGGHTINWKNPMNVGYNIIGQTNYMYEEGNLLLRDII